MHSLTDTEALRIHRLLYYGEQARYTHFQHCLDQMARFAREAGEGRVFNALQFGLNLGRAQELVGASERVDDWWRVFRPLAEGQNWGELVHQVEHYRVQIRDGYKHDPNAH